MKITHDFPLRKPCAAPTPVYRRPAFIKDSSSLPIKVPDTHQFIVPRASFACGATPAMHTVIIQNNRFQVFISTIIFPFDSFQKSSLVRALWEGTSDSKGARKAS